MSGPADSVYFVNCSNPRSKPTTALLDSSVPASFVLTSVGRSTVWFCSCTAVVETALVLSLAELHSIGLEPSCLELYLSSFDLSLSSFDLSLSSLCLSSFDLSFILHSESESDSEAEATSDPSPEPVCALLFAVCSMFNALV